MTQNLDVSVLPAGPAARPTTPPGVPEVRAVSRAITLLRAFQADRADWTLADLARASGLDKGTARRLLHTLSLCGLVEYDEGRRSYSLTLGLLELAAGLHRGAGLQTFARPVLTELAELIGGTAFLWVADHGTAICLDRVIAPHSIITTLIAVGNRVPLNCGAALRVILAYLPEAEREQALAGPLARWTPASETRPEQLRAICARIREQGYEYVADDFITGLAALGVPVFDGDGLFRAAISITNLTDRFEFQDGRPVLLEPMLQAARRLARKPLA
jgi:DNA-binding IclR family transcriptional regulator